MGKDGFSVQVSGVSRKKKECRRWERLAAAKMMNIEYSAVRCSIKVGYRNGNFNTI